MPTCRKCQTYFPVWMRIAGKKRNLSSRHYCLACSPFGRHNTRNLMPGAVQAQYCLRCSVELTEQNCYKKPQSSTFQPYCKTCFNARSHERQKQIKRLCVEYKGGRCSRCGYDRCLQALEFHHIGSESKEREISGMKSRSFERLKPELDKCILVCANCHREIHASA